MLFSQVTATLAFLTTFTAGTPITGTYPGVRTWWHDTGVINTATAVEPGQVRQSRKYNVSVSVAGTNEYHDSFVYESIPRNGNGMMFDPAKPGETYNLTDGDGIHPEIQEGINMAWSQFEYQVDVDVKISSSDGGLGPADNVIIRPKTLGLQVSADDSITIRVPYSDNGYRFSVEFRNDIFEYRTNGTDYVQHGLLVSKEPRNALLVFASPPIPEELIPAKTSDVQVLTPGAIRADTIQPKPTLYFQAGVYWAEENGLLGKSHLILPPETHHVYFEPGTYVKSAIEYTTTNADFYTIGHGVVSGENYAYMANWNASYAAIKDDRTSLRMFSHQSVQDYQTWHCMGPTLNAPPFNTMDLFPKNPTDHEEDNRVHSYISDYKQVGAYYLQTDGTQIYAGTVRDIFWHVNDDAIKLYHSNVRVQDLVIWKAYNDPIIQMGWKPRNVSNVTVDGLDIIHGRWFKSETVVPSSILGASPYYMDPKLVDVNRTMQVSVKNVRCEGICPALMRLAPMQNYELEVENIEMEELFDDEKLRLGESLVGVKISEQEDDYVEGQEPLDVSISIKNWTVAGTRMTEESSGVGSLGQVNFNATLQPGLSVV